MSLNFQGGTPKKDSIFSAITPAQPAPAPVAAPAPAPRPAVDPDAVMALKQKIDVLEKNIVTQLEKRLGEQARPAPPLQASPPPPPPVHDLLYRKIEELERRLSDSAAISASQLRNIEESKISARREIEDLLKAVREQHKYSEMDRQMHAQLEKSWARAEELEKKLMDFYSSVLAMEARRRDESSAASDRAASAAEALAARLGALEQKLSQLPSFSQLEDLRRGQEELRSSLAQDLDSALSAKQAELRSSLTQDLNSRFSELPSMTEVRASQEEFFAKAEEERRGLAAAQAAGAREVLAGLKESAASFREIFDSYVRSEFKLLQDKFSDETSGMRREISGAVNAVQAALGQQAESYAAENAQIRQLLADNRLKADGVEASLEASARRQALALEEFGRRMDADLRAISAEYLSAAKKENDERFARFGAKYADALLTVTFVEGFRAAVLEAVDKLEAHQGRMTEFLANVNPVQLEKVMGVSGEVVRRQLEAMSAASVTLKEDLSRLREIKGGIENKVRDIFGAGQ